MPILLLSSALTSLVFAGAIFGFFYAWVCSTMWGLDAADPRVAIAAMQAMNASVRNAVFAPAFFATPLVLLGTAAVMLFAQRRRSALFFAVAGGVYLVGGAVLTMAINVPMNEALAGVQVPDDIAAAHAIWQDYSGRWQFWNQVRTVFSGAALVLAGYATLYVAPPTSG
ncbi:MAG: DUF1772 domain-containing protein [Sedimentitalea sp.]